MYIYIHNITLVSLHFLYTFLVYSYFNSLSIIILVVCRYNRNNRRVRGGFGVGLIKFMRVQEGLGMYYLFKPEYYCYLIKKL